MLKIFKTILLFTLICLGFNAYSSHLIGGNLGYEYLGQVGNNYQYKILYTIYVDCGPTSNAPNPFSTEEIGVYTHDLQNSPMGGADKTRIQLVTVNLISVTDIEPDLPSGCSVGSSTCIREGKYEGIFTVPLNFTGYHLYGDICCRNNGIDNLTTPNQQGTGFHAYIPPPLIENDSPVFTDVPIPFLCAGDTTSILNSAFDPDGDLMVFSFVEPFRGFGTQGFYPAPPATLTWTLDPVNYAPTYSFTQPFGPSSYSSINASTGLTQYMAPTVGNYVVAVEIKEYRNGNLIGVSRRDLQLLVINCPVNPPPNLDPQFGSAATQYSVEEGETICFDFGFNDPNGDSLSLTSSGIIFDPLFTNPPATITSPVNGVDTVSTQFCWTTACGQAQALPYQFQVSATDRGCPPKTTNEVFEITVNPVSPPDTIIGSEFTCQFNVETYSTITYPNTTYDWSIIGGNIISNNDSIIQVEWLTPGTGTVSLSSVNQFGCLSSSISLDVTVTSTPSVDIIGDSTICSGDSIVLTGSTSAAPGYTLSWSPNNSSIINNTTLTPTVFPTDSTYYILEINSGIGCIGLDSVLITTTNSQISAGFDTTMCEGDTMQLFATGGISYNWIVTDSLNNSSIANPLVWPTITTDYIVEGFALNGCSNTDTVVVSINPKPALNPGPDLIVCYNESVTLSGGGSLLGVTYTWNNGITDGIAFNATSTSNYIVVAQDLDGCLNTDSVLITVGPQPTLDAGVDLTYCYGDSIQFNASGANNYSWSPTTNLSNPLIANPFCSASDTTQYVVSTDTNNCTFTDTLIVFVSPPPYVNAGNDISICIGDSAQLEALASCIPEVSQPLALPDGTGVTYQTCVSLNCYIPGQTLNNINDLQSICLEMEHSYMGDLEIEILCPSGQTVVLHNYSSGGGTNLGIPFLGNPNVQGTPFDYCFTTGATNGTWAVESQGLSTLPAGDYQSSEPLTNLLGCELNGEWCLSITDNLGIDDGYIFSWGINLDPSLSASPPGAFTYLWTPSTGLSDTIIADPLASPSTTTSYIVTGTNVAGCSNSDTVTVNVNNLPVVSISNDTTICLGDTIQLLVSGGSNYEWINTSNISNSLINNPLAWPTSTTTYQVVISDTNTCSDTAQVTITVNSIPVIDAGLDVSICNGDTIQLNASGAINYSWIPLINIINANSSNPNVWPTSNSEYIVTGTDINNCSSNDTVNVFVFEIPDPDIIPDQLICPGDTVTLNVNSTGTLVESFTMDFNDPFSYVTTNTNYVGYYYIEVSGSYTGAGNPFQRDAAFYFATTPPVPSVEWQMNGASPAAQQPANTYNPLHEYSFYFYGGIPQDFTWIDSGPYNDNFGSLDFEIYYLGDILWSNGDTTYYTTVQPNSTTTIDVTVSNHIGCTGHDTVTIDFHSINNTIVNDTSICIGDTIQLIANGGTNYDWSPTGFISDPFISNPLVWPIATTNYEVIISDINGCLDTNQVTVTVNPLPVIDAGLDDTICIGDTTQLLVSGANSYLWSPASSLSASNIANPFAWPLVSTSYIVTGTDLNSCSNTDTVDVVVNNLPAVDAGLPASICLGDSTQLQASGADTYVWTPAGSLSNATISNPMASPSVTTTYFVVGTDLNACINIDSVDVSINSLPTASISNDTTICIGDTIQLVASGGTNYEWSPTDSISDPFISNPIVWPTTTTTYQLIVSDLNGCNDTISVTVTVQPLPTILAGNDETICINDTVQLTAAGALNYTWSPTDSLSANNIANPLAWPTDTTVYVVTGADALGCISTDTIAVNVNPLPPADAGDDEWICPGDDIQLNASGGITYTWFPVTGLTNPNIADPIATLTDTVTYQVEVISAFGCINYDTMTVFVNQTVPTQAGNDTIICFADSIAIGGNPTAVNGTTYQWSPATLVNNPTLANPMVSPSVPTMFYVLTSNDTCTGLDSVFVDIHPNTAANAGLDVQICIGDTAQLSASGGIDFLWIPAATLTDDTIANPQAFPTDTTDYIVTITDANACIGTDTVTVIVNPLPTVDAGTNVDICIGDSIGLTATGGDIYAWSPNDSISDSTLFNPLVWPVLATEYFVEVTDSNGCINNDSVTVNINQLPNVSAGADDTICIGSAAQLIGTGAINYSWSPSDSLTAINIPFPIANPSVTMDYFLEGTDANGCVNFDTVNIFVRSLPTIDAGDDVEICLGTSTQLNASGGDSYLWTPTTGLTNPTSPDPIADPSDTTSYVVQGTDIHGCVNTDTVIVIVNSLPNADAGFNANICENTSTQLNATGGDTYLWSPSAFLDDDTLADPIASPDTSMLFTVVITDSNNCVATDSVYIVVFMIHTVEDELICLGDSVQLNVFGEPAISFSWSPTAGLNDPNIINPMATPNSTTTYTVTATDSQGCIDEDDITIEISSDVASFDTFFEPGCEGVVVEFTNTSNPDVDILWNFSDGDTSTLDFVEHIFDFSSSYWANLSIVNIDGCVDTAFFNDNSLSFEDYFNIEIPNVFTPNGDGNNELFEVAVPGRLNECVDFKVYNRWGQIMFISSGNNIKWDGRTNVGEEASPGSYFYTIDIKGKIYKGNLNLFR